MRRPPLPSGADAGNSRHLRDRWHHSHGRATPLDTCQVRPDSPFCGARACTPLQPLASTGVAVSPSSLVVGEHYLVPTDVCQPGSRGKDRLPALCLVQWGAMALDFAPVGDSQPDHVAFEPIPLEPQPLPASYRFTLYRDGVQLADSAENGAVMRGIPNSPATFRAVLDVNLTATAASAPPARAASVQDACPARRLLVATGLRDELPRVPGLAERWGIDVLHCPFCHGREVRDKRIAILATSPGAMHQVLLFRQLSEQVTVLAHTVPQLPGEQRSALGIAVIESTVTRVEASDSGLTGVRLADGTRVPLDALIVAPRTTARAELLAPPGLAPTEVTMGGQAIGTRIEADPSGATSVPGVWDGRQPRQHPGTSHHGRGGRADRGGGDQRRSRCRGRRARGRRRA
jgi:hypothetical protein